MAEVLGGYSCGIIFPNYYFTSDMDGIPFILTIFLKVIYVLYLTQNKGLAEHKKMNCWNRPWEKLADQKYEIEGVFSW